MKLYLYSLKYLLLSSVFIITLNAQPPETMSYQAVIRDAGNKLVAEQSVSMRISILQGSESGKVVYVETHTRTTNQNGLVSIEIGGGRTVSGKYADIYWPEGPYFLKTETDPSGGVNYTITGTSRLLSVPYSNYSRIGGFHVKKMHTEDVLSLVLTDSFGPNVPGASTDVGDISDLKGLIIEWRLPWRTIFQQFIYLSQHDKDVITGKIPLDSLDSDSYPRAFTTILADSWGTMMWLGISLQGTRLYISTNSKANPEPILQRIYGIL